MATGESRKNDTATDPAVGIGQKLGVTDVAVSNPGTSIYSGSAAEAVGYAEYGRAKSYAALRIASTPTPRLGVKAE